MPYRAPVHRPHPLPEELAAPVHRHEARGSSSARGYGARWRRLRAMVLSQEPLCRACLERGATTPATDVDHIRPRRLGGTDRRDNLQALCHACHSSKTGREDRPAMTRGGRGGAISGATAPETDSRSARENSRVLARLPGGAGGRR